MFCSVPSSANGNTEENSEDYHSKWFPVGRYSINDHICMPKDIIYLMEDVELLLHSLGDIRIVCCNKLSNNNADVMAKK